MGKEEPVQAPISRIRAALAYRFHLRDDQSSFSEIDKNIRDGIEVRGTNLWVLMLAIFIASIGLDVNSTAVIIGAMLISPLMGPIMGVGYGAAINDYLLIKKALGNLLVSILIALSTSTAYFLVSPLSVVKSELLARTTPTIWDVLIALFGGLAGIIASTHKEKSNVIPGVAIATALMPPLCTAGYGIANLSIEMFFGAFYLFFINGVFIAFATLLLVGYINPPHKKFVSAELERKVKRYIYAVVLATVLPSIYLAYGLVKSEVFNSKANEFIRHELVFENSFITKQKVIPNTRVIEVTLVGKKIGDEALSGFSEKLAHYQIPDAKLVIHQAVSKELDVPTLKKTLLSEMLSANQDSQENKSKILELQNAIASLQEQQGKKADDMKEQERIFEELVVLYPQVRKLALAKTHELQTARTVGVSVLLVNVVSKKPLSKEDQTRMIAWLKTRTGVDLVKLILVAD